MSISFSGLATGLDTSSWVESLVKIKQEKVNSYESTKKTLELTQEAVASIKSFFTSFRSVLEKVTDTKFGAAATDVFAQKLAASTNANIVSAIATNEAEEAKYDVNVDKLATQTKASSGIKQLETITQIQTATLNTKLGDLGVKNGSIDVTVNNVKNNIVISADNSIADFITKLKNIGVESNFNEKTGVFSVDLSKGSLVDNGTGIVEAFHLESSGWESTKLVTYTTTTVTSTASGDTKLSEISSSINSGNVELDVNGATYTVAIDKDMTLSSFVNTLNSYGVDAKLDDDGTLTIKDATISDVDNTNLLEGLGLISDVSSKSQITSGLKFTTVITTGVEATGSTKLSELDGWENISGTPQILIPYDSGTLAIDFTGDSTLDDVVYELNNNSWLKAEFKDGMLTVSGGTVSGNVAELLGLTDKNISKVSTTGEKLYATVVTTATGDTKLADLGITINDDFFTAISIKDGTNYSTIYEQKTMSADATLNDYFAILAGYGINASISDGKITVDSNGKFDSGRIALELGITPSTTTAIVSNSLSSTTPISYTITKTADANTTLGELGLGDKQGYIKGPNEGILATITGSSTMTVGDVLDNLKNQGITASIDNGVISITNSSSYVFTGELAEALGIQTVSTLTGTTIATSTSSSVPLTYTTSTVATADSRISDFVGLSGNTSENKVYFCNQDGSLSHSITINSNTTFSSLVSSMTDFGIDASFSDGRIVINSNNSSGKYVKSSGSNGILTKLGITTTFLSSTTTVTGTSYTGTVVTYTTSVSVTQDNVSSVYLKDCVDGFVAGETMTVYYDEMKQGTITVNSDMTVYDLQYQLEVLGLQNSLNSDGSITLLDWNSSTLSHRYVTGDFADRMGWTNGSSTIKATTTLVESSKAAYGNRTVSSQLTSYATIQQVVTRTQTATLDSKISGCISNWDSIDKNVYLRTSAGNVVKTITVSDTSSFSQVFDTSSYYVLKPRGGGSVQASMTNGVLTLTQVAGTDTYENAGKRTSDYYYFTGAIVDALGIGTTTDSQTLTKTVGVSYTGAALKTSDGVSSAYADTKLTDLYCNDGSGSVLSVGTSFAVSWVRNEVYNYATFTVESTSTVESFVDWLNSTTGITSSIIPVNFQQIGSTVQYSVVIQFGGNENAYFDMIGSNYTNYTCLAYKFFGLSNTYNHNTTTSVNRVKNTSSNSQIEKYTVQSAATTSSKLTELANPIAAGTKLEFSFMNGSTGNAYYDTFTVTSTSTVDNMLTFLKQHAIDYSFSDGKLTIESGDTCRITKASDEFLGAFKIYSNQYNPSLYYTTVWTTASETTKVYDILGTSSSRNLFTFGDGSKITSYSSMTMGDVINNLKAKGFDAQIYNGSLSIRATSNCSTYIKSMDSTFADAFGIKVGEGITYYTHVTNSTSNALNRTTTTQMTGDTKLTDLGCSIGSFNIMDTQTVSGGRTYETFTTSASTTVNDFINWLNNKGYSGSNISDGKITIGTKSDGYICWIGASSSYDNFFKKLGLSEDISEYKSESTSSIYGNTSSYKLEKDTTYTADSSTTLGQLGLVGTGTIVMKSTVDNSVRTVTVSDTDTLGSLKDAQVAVMWAGILQTAGGDEIIYSMSNNLKDVLKLDVGEGYTYYVSGSTTYSNVTDGTTLIATETGYINENTIIKNINGYSHGSGVISIKDYNDSSYNKTITINQDGTLGDFLTQLRENGLSASVISDGRVSISASDGLHVEGISGGSNIISCFKMMGGATTSTIYNATTDGRTIKLTQTVTATGSTKLNMIYNAPNSIDYPSDGNLTFDITATDKNGKTLNYQVDAGTKSNPITLDELFAKFKTCGIDATIDDGKITLSSTVFSDFTVESGSSNAAGLLFGSDKTYEIASNLNTETVTTAVTNATRDTLLKDLDVTAGEFYVYNNGVKYTALISDDETIGSFMDNLKSFGIQTGLMNTDDGTKLMIIGNGDSYIAKSNSTTNASNVVEKLFNNNIDTSYNYIGSEKVSTTTTAMNEVTKDTLLSEFDRGSWDKMTDKNNPGSYVVKYVTHKSEGTLEFNVRGEDKTISISSTETFGSLVDKLNEAGIASSFHDGKLYISNAYDINDGIGISSYLFSNIDITNIDMSGFMASGNEVQETTTSIVEKNLSAANYADFDTTLSSLNISDGTFSIFRNGKKSVITIDSTKTLGYLNTQIASATSADVELKLEDGKMVIYSKTDGVTVEAGTTTDSSNIQAVLGLTKDESGLFSKSTRELYRVNTDTLVTASGMFRLGTVKEGSFTVGNQEINIDNTTKLSDIINQINNSEDANATAYWDSINGKLVIQSRTTGAALINIEAGTSNFTDIMGYTNSKWKDDGSVDETRLNVANQELGSNAKFSINGTKYSATSNTITSDITKIKGLTLNLKDITENNPVTITIEKDKDKVANAIEDVVKSYNELMKNVDEQISSSGKLHDQSTLKIIRNQLRNLMTSSDDGATVFRNLSAIGISVSSASAKNTSTSNESIIDLSFDKDKFLEAYAKDADAVKALLVGGANNKGVFTKVEDLIESSLKSVTGYFDVTEKSIKSDISKNAMKITKANEAIERYRAQLEKKFSSMNLMISKAQQQYSSFLS